MSRQFRFEVPTSQGVFVVIGPDTLPPDEAERVGAQIGRLLPLMLLEPTDEPCTYRPSNGLTCGKPELDPVHPGPDERMGNGRHVYRNEP